MKNTLTEVLARFSGQLEKRNIRYALISGLAASIRGRVRATEDLDLILLCSLEDGLDLVPSLQTAGFTSLVDDYEEVARSALLLPLVDTTSRIQLDLAIGLSRFEQEIVERADPVMIDGSEIFVATAEDLIVLKMLADRPRDLQDIDGIIEVQAGQLDWDCCLSTAERLEEAISVDLVHRIEELKSN